MFTGIVEVALPIASIAPAKGVTRLTLDLSSLAESETINLGDSVALNGCCLTVANAGARHASPLRKARASRQSAGAKSVSPLHATFEAIPETLKLTNLGSLKQGSLVNVERAMKTGSRLDGHLVQGHVDGVGRIAEIKVNKGERRIKVKCGGDFARLCVHKGSVCLDGISLTIAELGPDWFTVAIIPHTWEVTNLHTRKAGDEVNLEADAIGKYVLAHMQRMFPRSTIDENLLRRAGW